MQSTALLFSLPTFVELKTTAARPRHIGVGKPRTMNVIAAVSALNLLKVAAYCRVSTDHDDQQESITIQQEHWKTFAAQHPEWDFVGVYVDIVSGTKKEKRPELQRLLTDCAEGRVGLVLTKSVSRFARNTTDLLEMVRSLAGIAEELNSRGIPTKRAGQVWKGKEIATIWNGGRISKILSNLSYTGEQVLQKCFTDDNFQMCRNRGQYPQYHLEEHHPAIIDKATFNTVQEMLAQNKPSTPPAPKQYTALSGMMTCGCCGTKLTRNVNRVGNVYWVCSRRRKKAKNCEIPSISEEAFQSDFMSLLERLKTDDSPVSDYLSSLNQSFHAAPGVAMLETRIDEIDRESDAIKHTRCRVTSSDFFSRLNALSAEREALQNELDTMKDNRIEMTEELLKLIHGSSGSFGFIFPMITEGVTVHARGVYTIHFRCGLEIEFNAAENTPPSDGGTAA